MNSVILRRLRKNGWSLLSLLYKRCHYTRY